jgi:hypothetical protein
MSRLKIKILDFETISKECGDPIPKFLLTEWINGGRQDILDNPDIFCKNVRCVNRKFNNFELFERVDHIDSETILIFSLYLELFEYHNKPTKMLECIDFYSKKYPNNTILFYYNHDNDFSKYNTVIEKYNNVKILNYNTSKKTENDIILPFWTYSDQNEIIISDKEYLCNFVGNINTNLRYSLCNTFYNKPGYFISRNVDYQEFNRILASSKFTFCPRGLGLSSYRFFECMFMNSIPVLLADSVILPYADTLNYDDFIIRIPENRSNDFDYINSKLLDTDFEEKSKVLLNNIKHFRLDGIQEFLNSKFINYNI